MLMSKFRRQQKAEDELQQLLSIETQQRLQLQEFNSRIGTDDMAIAELASMQITLDQAGTEKLQVCC